MKKNNSSTLTESSIATKKILKIEPKILIKKDEIAFTYFDSDSNSVKYVTKTQIKNAIELYHTTKQKTVVNAEAATFKNIESKEEHPINFKTIEARTTEEKKLAYKIRYKAYIADSSIVPNSQEQFKDQYDEQPNHRTFLLFNYEEPIGTIRACIYDPKQPQLPIPSFVNYSEEIDCHLGFNKPIVESCRFSILPEFRKGLLFAKFHLFKHLVETVFEKQAKYLITTVRASQQNLYKALFFEPISEEKEYPCVLFKTVLLYTSPLKYYLKFLENPNDPIIGRATHFCAIISETLINK